MKHEFCNRIGCYTDHGEWNCAPLKRCLKCDELFNPDDQSECNPPVREPITPGLFYANYISLTRNSNYPDLKTHLKMLSSADYYDENEK